MVKMLFWSLLCSLILKSETEILDTVGLHEINFEIGEVEEIFHLFS